jgi:hypothetical protein
MAGLLFFRFGCGSGFISSPAVRVTRASYADRRPRRYTKAYAHWYFPDARRERFTAEAQRAQRETLSVLCASAVNFRFCVFAT